MTTSYSLRPFCPGWLLMLAMSLLAACSNGRGSLDSQPPTGGGQESFTVGGTITGLAGSGLVLQNNGGDDLAASNNGAFTFNTRLAGGAAYNVTVLTQPTNPAQTCTVGSAGGTIGTANVTSVTVTCATGAFAVRGTVAGLAGSGLVLQNNGGDDLPISANGDFTFATPVTSGQPYSVTVRTQPTAPSQSCTVGNAAGTVSGADIVVTVTCSTGSFTVGGTVTGLQGSGLVLQNNGGDDVTISGNGPFAFATPLASGATYNVTVRTHPTNPNQSCTVKNAAGTVGSASVTNVAVECMTNRFTVGGTVAGLVGSGLVLRLNGGNERQISANGAFAFPMALPSGTAYVVDVKTDPSNPAQTCTPTNNVGVVLNANVTNVTVTCATRSFTIGGKVSGLQGSGLVLQKNGGNDLAIASNGDFTFDGLQASGTSYNVTVRTPPTNPSQTCTVANGTGTVGSGNVRSIRVSCDTNTFSVGGTVSGLAGSGLVLENNGGDALPITADGAFTFPHQLASGSAFSVTVRTQPSNPTQSCSVAAGGSGTITNANVTNVQVSCSTSTFTIGGTVSGLAGSGLVLQNNGGDNLAIGADGSFTFAPALPSGSTYNITVAVQPTGPAQSCTVTNGSGSVIAAVITDVQVTCVTTEFTIGGSVSGLSGSGFVLQNNGADNLQIAANGSFTFPTSLLTGATYNVTVLTQPTNLSQTCTVTNGAGTVGSANVTDVGVTCVSN